MAASAGTSASLTARLAPWKWWIMALAVLGSVWAIDRWNDARPGPEAHELCVHFGMLARGRLGGLLAGLGFMLPGFVLMFLLSWLYLSANLAETADKFAPTLHLHGVIALSQGFLLTSLISFCPLYTLVGFSTCPAKKA